jgi:flagellin-like protein
MNIWGKRERSWRRKNKRAVSPIIATILLVAITVVLAAVLYILIQQYTKNGSNGSPLGSALAFGNSADASTATTNYYNMTVESASSTLTIGNVIFQLKSPSNAITSVAGLSISIVNPKGAVEATYTFSTLSWGSYAAAACSAPAYTSACSTTTTITTANLFAVSDVTATSGITSLVGYSLVALGQGGFQGTVNAAIS